MSPKTFVLDEDQIEYARRWYLTFSGLMMKPDHFDRATFTFIEEWKQSEMVMWRLLYKLPTGVEGRVVLPKRCLQKTIDFEERHK